MTDLERRLWKLTPGERADLEGRLRPLIPPDDETLGITTPVRIIDG